jgi:hypothetical protein
MKAKITLLLLVLFVSLAKTQRDGANYLEKTISTLKLIANSMLSHSYEAQN